MDCIDQLYSGYRFAVSRDLKPYDSFDVSEPSIGRIERDRSINNEGGRSCSGP